MITDKEKRKIIKYMVFMRRRGYNSASYSPGLRKQFAIAYGEIKSPRLLFVKMLPEQARLALGNKQARRVACSIYGATYRNLHNLPDHI